MGKGIPSSEVLRHVMEDLDDEFSSYDDKFVENLKIAGNNKRKALYKSSFIYNKKYFCRDRSLLIQKTYTLSCLAVMLVDLLAFYYGYHQFTHFPKNNSGGNGLNN